MAVRFRIQSTPNPNARKYILSKDVKAEGKVSYKELEECEHVPMAAALLSLPSVVQVHFFENMLTVTQDGAMEWARLDQAIQSLVSELIDAHDVNFIESVKGNGPKRELGPEMQKIDEILEHTIRPGLQADGGDVELIELEGHVLTIRYMGACGGCPSATMGTLDAMTAILRDHYHPELEIVAL